MAKGNYEVLHNPERTDIIFEIRADSEEVIPTDQQDLVIEIGSTLAILRLLYSPDNKIVRPIFDKRFDELFYMAKTGLEGDRAQPQLAVKALAQFKKEIVDSEGGKVKNKYLKKLGLNALYLGLPFLLLGSLIHYLDCKEVEMTCFAKNYTANCMILWAGALIGVWLSFAITRTYLEFTDLAIIEKDRLEPLLRLVFTGVLAIVFGLLFIIGALEIKLGSLSSSKIASDPITAFLIGVILGLNEKIIGNTLTKKASALFKE
jgi:hypothetical protein